MATTSMNAQEQGMSVGRVYSRAFATIAHNPAVTLGLALLLGALPSVLIGALVVTPNLSGMFAQEGPVRTGVVAVTVVGYLANFGLSALVQGASTRATVAESQGRKASMGECLQAGLAVLFPLLGVTILWFLGMGIGFMLLLVPAAILGCMWAVAIPALVEERVGVIAAFGRSRELTRGYRWKVFGVLLLLLAGYYFFSAAVGILTGSLGTMMETGTTGAMPLWLIIFSAVTGTLFNAVWGTLAPSMYIELRNAKEGGSVGELEQVFA